MCVIIYEYWYKWQNNEVYNLSLEKMIIFDGRKSSDQSFMNIDINEIMFTF